MKKTFIFLLFAYTFNSVIAQPTINSSWAPSSGISYKSNPLDGSFGLDEGNPGASQTWDLTSEDTLSALLASYIAPASAPSSGNFPGATDVLNSLSTGGNSTYTFNKLVGNIYQMVGVYQPSSNYVINFASNPLDVYHFPMTMSSSFNDGFRASGSYNSGGQSGTLKRNGTIAVEVDGYGTLITHIGTFNNVLRVKTVQDIVDSVTSGGVESILTYHYETFVWISSVYRGVVLASITHSLTNGFTQDYGYVSRVVSTGIDEQKELNAFNFNVSPVPAATTTTLSFNAIHKTKLDINVYNSLGELIYQLPEQIVEVGERKIAIPVETWENGMYFVNIKTDKATLTKPILVQR